MENKFTKMGSVARRVEEGGSFFGLETLDITCEVSSCNASRSTKEPSYSWNFRMWFRRNLMEVSCRSQSLQASSFFPSFGSGSLHRFWMSSNGASFDAPRFSVFGGISRVSISMRWTSCKCFFSSDFRLKAAPLHTWQGYGRTSEWLRRCCLRYALSIKVLPQVGHGKFVERCTISCFFKETSKLKERGHCEHFNFPRLLCCTTVGRSESSGWLRTFALLVNTADGLKWFFRFWRSFWPNLGTIFIFGIAHSEK